MPKVVVYVPAAAWRKLEERGLDPAATVREFARRGYDMNELAEVPVAEQPTVEGSRDPRQPQQAASTTPKKRLYPCDHHVPPSRVCPTCDLP